jgi:hypothetical protein
MKRSKNKLFCFVLPVLTCFIGFYIANLAGHYGSFHWGFPYYVCEISSPADPSDKIIFVEEEYLRLYIISKGKKPQFISRLGWEYSLHFYSGQWTQDGKVFVSTLGKGGADKSPTFIAYDFGECRALLPSSQRYADTTTPEGDGFLSEVKKVIATHGGLMGPSVDYNAVRKAEKREYLDISID